MDLLDHSYQTELAPKRIRVLAAFIDLIIIWIIGFIFGFFFGEPKASEQEIGFHVTGLPAFIFLLFIFILIPVMEGITGQTIGKKLSRIKVIKENGADISFLNSLVRHLFDFIDMIFLVGLIVASTNSKKQRIGDIVARTIVIRK